MKLCEMAQEYRVNVALLELRIKQLQAAQKRTRQPEVRYRLKQRAKFLQTLMVTASFSTASTVQSKSIPAPSHRVTPSPTRRRRTRPA